VLEIIDFCGQIGYTTTIKPSQGCRRRNGGFRISPLPKKQVGLEGSNDYRRARFNLGQASNGGYREDVDRAASIVGWTWQKGGDRKRSGSSDEELEIDYNHGILSCSPVYMELPGFAKVLNKDDLEISLDDVSFGTFQGCTDFELIAMIDITLGCKVKGNRKVRGDYSCSIDNPQVPATGSTPEIRKVCVKLENAKFYYFATSPDERVQVATLTLTVSAR